MRICSKAQLSEFIKADYAVYDIKHPFLEKITYNEKYICFNYMKNLRYLEYHINKSNMNSSFIVKLYHKIMNYYYLYRHRKLSVKYGLNIPPNCVGKGFHIVHLGYRHILPTTTIGENCTILPMVLIGMKSPGLHNPEIKIGRNCYIGTGATILGPLSIADDVLIAAGSVVCSDVAENQTIIGGGTCKNIKETVA